MSGSNSPLALTVAQFRDSYPVFGNAAEFPDSQIEYWLQEGSNMCDANRWGNLLALGVGFFTAHYLTIMKRLNMSGANGQAGLVLSKTVGKASVDYDTTATAVKNAGPWNATTFGQNFIEYARMVGSGGWQATGPLVVPPYGWPYGPVVIV